MNSEILIDSTLDTTLLDSSKFFTESKSIEEKWINKKPELAQIKPGQKRMAICVLLENQYLMNCCIDGVSFQSKTLDLVLEVYSQLLAWNFISIQPLLGPTGLVFYLDSRVDEKGHQSLFLSSDAVAAYTKKFAREVCTDFGIKDTAKDIAKELDAEFIQDIYNNVGTVASVNLIDESDKSAALKRSIDDLINALVEKKRQPTWMLVSEAIYHKYSSVFFTFQNNLRVIPHRSIFVDDILIGRKGDSCFDAGYVYSPYVPFTFTPSYMNDAYGILARYGKKLVNKGSYCYGRLKVIESVSDLIPS